jgi:diguanylate cyclase (GGDEF)-like protein/PAS domain S-box-containing protein
VPDDEYATAEIATSFQITARCPNAMARKSFSIRRSRSERRAFWLCVALLAPFFVVDLLLPLGIAVSLPYVLIVFLALRTGRNARIVTIAAIASLLTVADFAFSPRGPAAWSDATNTLITLASIWIAAALSIQYNNAERRTRDVETRSRFLAAIVQSTDDAVMSVSADGLITSWNRGAEHLFGYTSAEIVGKPYASLAPDDRRHGVEELVQRILAGQHRKQMETVGRRKDGSLVEISLSLSPLTDPSGAVIGLSSIGRDITARKRAEERTSYLAALVENSNEAVVGKTLDGVVTAWNKGAQRIYGYSAREMIGTSIAVVFPPERQNELHEILSRVRHGHMIENFETERIAKDGRRIYVSLTVSPIIDRHGHLVGFSTIGQDITERKRAEEQIARHAVQLEALAQMDPLTGLLNRRGIQHVLSREVANARRHGSSLMAILIDIDNFKWINDSLGYNIGDQVLREITEKMRECLRLTDYEGRIGGDEFLILLPDTRFLEGMQVAEKIRLAVADKTLTSVGQSAKVTASLGVVTVPRDTASVDELLARAYLALRGSKIFGKNRVVSDRSEGPDGGHPLHESDILGALQSDNRLYVVKQPIVRLADQETVGYEFLSRLSAGEFGVPEQFFRISLEARCLTLVDRRCFKNCVAAAARVPASMQCHFNLFPSTIVEITAERLLEELNGERERLDSCIEISEQQILGESLALAREIERFKKAGVRISIDDVGFGQSSLESLILLEPETIKIDKKYVTDLTRHDWKRRSLERLLRIAESLGAETIAEGIQNPEDLRELRNMGVLYGQGFLLGRPE